TFPIFMNRSLGWFPRTWIVGDGNSKISLEPSLTLSRSFSFFLDRRLFSEIEGERRTFNTYLKFPKGFILLQPQITSPFSQQQQT
ncbi:hypothetical protein ALC56_11047, partial [Trachymyrmex septentrionalis]